MPNSKLMFNVSYKKWHRVDLKKTGEPLTPEYEVPEREALEYALHLIEMKEK